MITVPCSSPSGFRLPTQDELLTQQLTTRHLGGGPRCPGGFTYYRVPQARHTLRCTSLARIAPIGACKLNHIEAISKLADQVSFGDNYAFVLAHAIAGGIIVLIIILIDVLVPRYARGLMEGDGGKRSMQVFMGV